MEGANIANLLGGANIAYLIEGANHAEHEALAEREDAQEDEVLRSFAPKCVQLSSKFESLLGISCKKAKMS